MTSGSGGHVTTGPVPVVTWDARTVRLDLRLPAESGSRRRAVRFSSPVWVDLRGDEVVSVDLLDVPDELHGTARDTGPWQVSFDTGWLWIALDDGPATGRLVGVADVEVLLDGPRLTALRARLAEAVRQELS